MHVHKKRRVSLQTYAKKISTREICRAQQNADLPGRDFACQLGIQAEVRPPAERYCPRDREIKRRGAWQQPEREHFGDVEKPKDEAAIAAFLPD